MSRGLGFGSSTRWLTYQTKSNKYEVEYDNGEITNMEAKYYHYDNEQDTDDLDARLNFNVMVTYNSKRNEWLE